MNQVDMARLADAMCVNLNKSFYIRIGSHVYQCMMTLDGFKIFDTEYLRWVKAPQIVGEIVTNGYEVLKVPKVNELYYIPVLDDFTLFDTDKWVGNALDMRRLARGLVFATKGEAVNLAKEMLALADEKYKNT